MRLVVDSDGGIDDAAALSWLAGQRDVELAAVTAVGGNVAVGQAGRNLRIILEAAGKDTVPVHLGADPTGPAPPRRRPIVIHGEDGLGDITVPEPAVGVTDGRAVEELASALTDPETTVLTIGPLTNLAAALVALGSAPRARLVVMGGSAKGGGNARPFGEANIANDPGAGAAVLQAEWSVPPVLVGLDVTHLATLRESEFELLAERRTPAAAFLAPRLEFYKRFGGTFCAPGETPCHDLLAAMVAIDPTMVRTELLPVEVDTGGSAAWGSTIVDFRVRHWRELAVREGRSPDDLGDTGNLQADSRMSAVALDVDVDRFRSAVRRLFGG
jgi:inosine-uridine nucleoside N-ribohydrolase